MPPARGLLPLPHVQFWETENSWRLDSSHRGGRRRDIPCLVDASDIRTVNALKTPRAWSMSSIEILRQLMRQESEVSPKLFDFLPRTAAETPSHRRVEPHARFPLPSTQPEP